MNNTINRESPGLKTKKKNDEFFFTALHKSRLRSAFSPDMRMHAIILRGFVPRAYLSQPERIWIVMVVHGGTNGGRDEAKQIFMKQIMASAI